MKNCAHRAGPINQKVNRCNTQLWKTKSISKTKPEWDKTRCNCDRSEQQKRIYCHMLNKIFRERAVHVSLLAYCIQVIIMLSLTITAVFHPALYCTVLCCVRSPISNHTFCTCMLVAAAVAHTHRSLTDRHYDSVSLKYRHGLVSTIFQIYFTCTLCVCCWFFFLIIFRFTFHWRVFALCRFVNSICVVRCALHDCH